MLVFLTNQDHTYTHRCLVQRPGLPPIVVLPYEQLLLTAKLPQAVYVFLDRERMDSWELRTYGKLFQFLKGAPGCSAYNDPARMLDRKALLRTLYRAGKNPFNAYPVIERSWPQRYPVFIRRDQDHGQPLSDLIADESALKAALAQLSANGEPEEGVLIVEYAAEPVRHGLFRKLSAYRIGPRVLFHNAVHENNWAVKYGTLNSADDELYLEEQQMIADNAFHAEVREVFDLAHIDYGRIDFGLLAGKVITFEINTNPNIIVPKPHPNPIRNKNQDIGWADYLAAVATLDPEQRPIPKPTQSEGWVTLPADDTLRAKDPRKLLPSRIIRP